MEPHGQARGLLRRRMNLTNVTVYKHPVLVWFR